MTQVTKVVHCKVIAPQMQYHAVALELKSRSLQVLMTLVKAILLVKAVILVKAILLMKAIILLVATLTALLIPSLSLSQLQQRFLYSRCQAFRYLQPGHTEPFFKVQSDFTF